MRKKHFRFDRNFFDMLNHLLHYGERHKHKWMEKQQFPGKLIRPNTHTHTQAETGDIQPSKSKQNNWKRSQNTQLRRCSFAVVNISKPKKSCDVLIPPTFPGI